MHLIVSPSAEQPSTSTSTSVDNSSAAAGRQPEAQPSPRQRPPQSQLLPLPTGETGSRGAGGVPGAAIAATSGRPERIQLSQTQLGQLQRQYQQALRENERTLEEHQQRLDFLSAQSRALTQQQHYQPQAPSTATAAAAACRLAPQEQQMQLQQPNEQEVSVRAATRALGGNMPGPTVGGGVRDITGPPPAGQIPAAGLGEDGDTGRGNLVDPAPRAPDIGREARGYFKMVVQCLMVTLVFGIDADGWVLGLLALGGFVAFLFRTGLLKEMLGSAREGGGLWKKLCTGATVITEDGGLLMDARFFCSAFFCSLFPK